MILLSIVAVLLLVDLICFINDKYIFSFFLLLGTVFGAWYFIPEFASLIATYGLFEVVGGYVAVGVAVAAVKWFIANISLWLKLRSAREDFKNSNASKGDKSQAERHRSFARFWNDAYGRRGSTLVPYVEFSESTFESSPNHLVESLTLRARNHIERISFWVLQWPIVIIATAFEDLLINIGRNVARFFDYAFTQFSRRLVASTIKDL